MTREPVYLPGASGFTYRQRFSTVCLTSMESSRRCGCLSQFPWAEQDHIGVDRAAAPIADQRRGIQMNRAGWQRRRGRALIQQENGYQSVGRWRQRDLVACLAGDGEGLPG